MEEMKKDLFDLKHQERFSKEKIFALRIAVGQVGARWEGGTGHSRCKGPDLGRSLKCLDGEISPER